MEDVWESLALIEVNVIQPLLQLLRVFFSLLMLINDQSSYYSKQAVVRDGQTFDYIIIGAGTAGSVVANRLTENSSTTVLLIEAGGPPTLLSDVPALFPLLDPNKTDWGHYSVDDEYSSQTHQGKRVHISAGKMIGGSSSVNYMSFVRGCKDDYNNWVQEGNKGWDWKTVLKYFKKSERLDDIDILKMDPYLHSTEGPLTVRRAVWKDRTHKYFEAFAENGHDILIDVNGKTQTGYSMAQFATDDYKRQGSANVFLRPALKRKNLYVVTKTLATQIVFDKRKRAIGVKAITANKKTIIVKARREIILSAGAINSPQLLMLSGIGPEEHLKSKNINVLVNSPNVGKNLQDHVLIPVKVTAKQDFSSIVDNIYFFTNLDKFPNPVMTGRVALNKYQTCPDYQSYVLPLAPASLLSTLLCTVSFEIKNEVCVAATKAGFFKETLFAVVALLRPESRGSVKLRSNNPKDLPIIRTGYFSDKRDLERHALYMEDFVTVINTTYLKSVNSEIVDYNIKECKRYRFGSHPYWKCHVLNMASSMWDYAGTCAMGPEGKGVVDERLRVRGVTGVRVVDASIFPTIISGNLNAAVTMTGEKASDMIKEDNGEINNTSC